MFLITGFLLGFLGSLHCAGMCGPIILAAAGGKSHRSNFFINQLTYNLGRGTSYVLIGGVVALLNMSFELVGLQQQMSILLGIGILCVLFFSFIRATSNPFSKLIFQLSNAVKKNMGPLLKQNGIYSKYGLGLINGFLPCGLVYVAAIGGLALGDPILGVLYMVAFGIGTWPMMFSIPILARRFAPKLSVSTNKLIPVFMVALSLLLIIRGLNLDIDYLSPGIKVENTTELNTCD